MKSVCFNQIVFGFMFDKGDWKAYRIGAGLRPRQLSVHPAAIIHVAPLF